MRGPRMEYVGLSWFIIIIIIIIIIILHLTNNQNRGKV